MTRTIQGIARLHVTCINLSEVTCHIKSPERLTPLKYFTKRNRKNNMAWK